MRKTLEYLLPVLLVVSFLYIVFVSIIFLRMIEAQAETESIILHFEYEELQKRLDVAGQELESIDVYYNPYLEDNQ